MNTTNADGSRQTSALVPPDVRLLPMSRTKEFSTLDKAKEFLLVELPSSDRNGEYYYRRSGLDAERGTVVLFQYDAQIIGSALFLDAGPLPSRLPPPDDVYTGIIRFDPASIRTFKPLGSAVIRRVWGSAFKKFGQGAQHLDPRRYPAFEAFVAGTESPENFTSRALDLAEPPGRVEVTISRIVRDTEMARDVKRRHDFTCQICNIFLTLPGGTRYAEAHHIRPLGGQHKGHDVLANILCLCPNCHALCDLGAIPLDWSKLPMVNGHTVGREHVNYHNEKLLRKS